LRPIGKARKLVPTTRRTKSPIAPDHTTAANTLPGAGQAPGRAGCWLTAPLPDRFGLLIGSVNPTFGKQYVSETRLLPTRRIMAAPRTITAETRTARFASYNSNGKMKSMNMVKPRKHPAL
jgi:hypothetical protein